MSALLLKKKYIEIKNNFSQLSVEQLGFIVQSVQNSMNPEKPTQFLKRCCEILVKIYVLMVAMHL